MRIEIWPEHGPQNSKEIFKKFIKSLQDAGDQVSINKETNGDVAVIWSVLWRGRMLQYQSIWERYRKAGKPIIVIEVGGLLRNISFKIGINGINRDADFANQTFDDQRWPLFKHELRPWNPTGDLIVICGQHDASEQWKGLPKMSQWIEQQIIEIRKYTTRPILVRPHPRNVINFDENKFKNVKVRLPKRDYMTYDDTDFKATLERTWAVVNHSSNPAMEAVIKGIPVFVSESSLCHDVGNIKLADINTPAMPNRLAWANKLAYTEWFADEIEQGIPWARIKNRLEEKYL
jgi:hypothetical protein|tara:strand:+ start:3537 stop:4406 length:870 start_codon:yes stop_codon:yes gene_type:complete